MTNPDSVKKGKFLSFMCDCCFIIFVICRFDLQYLILKKSQKNQKGQGLEIDNSEISILTFSP